MNTSYYTRIDGDLAGPYTVRELVRRGLDRDTPIFDDELGGYVVAMTVPGLARVIRRMERNRTPHDVGATTKSLRWERR